MWRLRATKKYSNIWQFMCLITAESPLWADAVPINIIKYKICASAGWFAFPTWNHLSMSSPFCRAKAFRRDVRPWGRAWIFFVSDGCSRPSVSGRLAWVPSGRLKASFFVDFVEGDYAKWGEKLPYDIGTNRLDTPAKNYNLYITRLFTQWSFLGYVYIRLPVPLFG